jgi:hypothetical protein
MNHFPLRGLALCALILALPLVVRGQQQQQQQTPIDAKADAILKRMGETLGKAKRVTFDSHAIADQLMPDGQKLQFAKNQKVRLQRPDKLSVDVTGDVEDLQFRYDGKRVTLYNPRTKSWGSVDMPASIDDTLDTLADKYAMAIPLADLVFADPYKCLSERVRSSQYLGEGWVFDAKCDHLAFRQSAIDWQIWIEQGDKPVPRKIVITFKESPGHPQYTAFLSNWNLSADVPESAFAFTPPAGAKQVEFAPTTQPAAAAGSGGGASPGGGGKQ